MIKWVRKKHDAFDGIWSDFSFGSSKSSIILLMEEILEHRGWQKNLMHDEVIYLSTGRGILNHQQYGLDNKSIPLAEGVLQYEMHFSSMFFCWKDTKNIRNTQHLKANETWGATRHESINANSKTMHNP